MGGVFLIGQIRNNATAVSGLGARLWRWSTRCLAGVRCQAATTRALW